MLQNYFKIAFRSLVKNKVSSFINIGGLAVGMAVAMLIGFWIWDELSFNTYHENYRRIAKIRQNVAVNGDIQTWKTVPYPLTDELRNHYGNHFKYLAMSSHRAGHILSHNENKLTIHGVYFECQAPEMLTLKMLRGSRAGLKEPSSILLAESVAQTFFGNADPMGSVMKIDNNQQVKVTGVYEDLPHNSTFAQVGFMADFATYLNTEKWIRAAKNPWNSNPVQAYAQIADNEDMDIISDLISNIKLTRITSDEAKYKPAIFLEPMRKWHLFESFINGIPVGGRIRYVWMFGIIGIFVLLLACINFMNLSTARTEKRAREAGIRKVVGSLRKQLIAQYFCESMAVVALSFLFALLLVQLSLPFFNELSGKKIVILWTNPLFWISGVCFSLLTGLIAGIYPALYLSSFQPVKALKGSFRVGPLAAVPRKVLVVLQFSVSVTLIICTIVVYRQVQFSKTRPVGYDPDYLLIIPLVTNDIPAHYEAVKQDLLQTGAITNISTSEGPATDVWGTDGNLNWKGKDPNRTIDFPNTGVSYDYGKTIGWQFVQGRDFSKEFSSDSSAFILNEAAVKYMKLKEPIGEIITWNNSPFTVIGVIKDVITESPYDAVRPSIYCMARRNNNFMFLRINPSTSISNATGYIEKVFKKYSPATPFEYKFVDEEYKRKFGNEERIGKLAGVFAMLAIFISCLGLFGLTSFVAEQRTKEIGIRKVLGASVYTLWRLLSKEFLLMIIVSLLIASPIAYYLMYNWLQNYSYRTGLSFWIFAIAGCGALLVTLITVSFQAIKAAIANPVKSLRTE